MGGAPGTRDTDLLEPDKSVQSVDALVLSGGSAFGLDAASGVVAGLRAQGRGFSLGALHVPWCRQLYWPICSMVVKKTGRIILIPN